MPNTTVQAAAEGMPKNLNRRRLLLAGAVVAAAVPIPAKAEVPLRSPEERWRLAQIEAEAAFRAVHPNLERVAADYVAEDRDKHAIFFISGHPPRT